MDFIEALMLLVAVVLSFLFWHVARPSRFPPGPWTLPVIGNLLQFNAKDPLKDLNTFAERYGPVYSLYFGTVPVVFVHGLQAIKEVLVTRGLEFADRPENPITDATSKRKGIVSAQYGRSWKEHRRFTLSTLRNFGLGKKSMEEKILEETSYLLQYFKNNMGAPFDPCFALDNAVSNIMCSIVFGKRFEYDDPLFQRMIGLIHERVKSITGVWAQIYNAIPLVRRLPLPHQTILKNAETVDAFLRSIQEEHKKTFIPGKPRDYIDCYLEEMEKQQQRHGGETVFDDENLTACLYDLFLAGTKSTSTTLLWGFLYMMAFPDVQERCHKEIEKAIGDSKQLNYDDKEKMPYMQAVLQEIQRFATVVPLGVSHAPSKEVSISGYVIPKGTAVVTNISSIHYEESLWKFPHEFNPSNFLNDKGEFEKPEAFMPFAAGDQELTAEDDDTNLQSQSLPLEHRLSDDDSLDFEAAEQEAGPSGMPGRNRSQDLNDPPPTH
ncbi:cytochrome P450 2J2-like isoform X2 [Lissotriton helveticus]